MRTIILYIGVLIADAIKSPLDSNLLWWLPLMYFIAIVLDINAAGGSE